MSQRNVLIINDVIPPILLESDEPPPGEVWTSEECRLWAELWTDDGVEFFHYNSTSKECRLYRTLQAECEAVGGPKEAPSFDQCAATTTESTTATTTKTTATTITSTAAPTTITTTAKTTATTTLNPTTPNGRKLIEVPFLICTSESHSQAGSTA